METLREVIFSYITSLVESNEYVPSFYKEQELA